VLISMDLSSWEMPSDEFKRSTASRQESRIYVLLNFMRINISCKC
jgi:hypothetical protein